MNFYIRVDQLILVEVLQQDKLCKCRDPVCAYVIASGWSIYFKIEA